MRTPPKQAPPAVVPLAAIEDVREYRFITPVFGGGAEAKKTDLVTPVRVASIRGQLRFWWRAVNPGGCDSVAKLQEAEELVFGSPTTRSKLVIRVKRQPREAVPLAVLKEGSPFGLRAGMEAIAYGAFPLRDSKQPYTHAVLNDFGKESFELAFSYPEGIRTDVEAMLWAWGHFGALGGRTRRGFGAIAQVSPRLLGIEEGWTRFVKVAPPVALWPRLAARPVFARGEHNSGKEALERLLEALRKIRQVAGVGRRRGQNGPFGRSYWPEPDAIRRLLPDQVGDKHGQPVTHEDVFPRAAFGTPIIFHFKKGDPDPGDTTLLPKGKRRLASRLLLRPHLGASGKIEAMALVLAHPVPTLGYVLAQGDTEIPVDTVLTAPYSIGGRSFVDPIQRFLAELL